MSILLLQDSWEHHQEVCPTNLLLCCTEQALKSDRKVPWVQQHLRLPFLSSPTAALKHTRNRDLKKRIISEQLHCFISGFGMCKAWPCGHEAFSQQHSWVPQKKYRYQPTGVFSWTSMEQGFVHLFRVGFLVGFDLAWFILFWFEFGCVPHPQKDNKTTEKDNPDSTEAL